MRPVQTKGEGWRLGKGHPMVNGPSMEDLLRRVRQGDDRAAAEFVALYEDVIRRRVRVWLRMQDARLRRVFDSMDVCQSVLASFLVRAAAGQYQLDDRRQLVNLLFQMARHKLAHQVAKHQARRRDVRRTEGAAPAALESIPGGPSPSRVVARPAARGADATAATQLIRAGAGERPRGDGAPAPHLQTERPVTSSPSGRPGT